MSEPEVDLLRQALKFMCHTDSCSMYEWSDAYDHFRTSFGVPIDSNECECGMIQLALRIERELFNNAAIPHQHREELVDGVRDAGLQQ